MTETTTPRRIYVASSWRNDLQPKVVEALVDAGHEVYDFKHPAEDSDGFHWTDVGMPSYDRATNSDVPVDEYLAGIKHPIAVEGFGRDFDAMRWADTCVLVLPCGRSAHLELGWFVGQGRRTAILLEGPVVVPELMYRMVDHLATDIEDVIRWAGGVPSWATLRDAVGDVMSNPEIRARHPEGMTAGTVLEEIRGVYPRAFPYASMLDVHDELSAIYGAPARG